MITTKMGFLRLLLLAVLLNIIAQAVHETGHLLVYYAYRRNPTWGFIGLVQLWDIPPLNPSGWTEITTLDGEIGWLRVDSVPSSATEKTLTAAAGPVASLLSLALGLGVAYTGNRVAFKHVGLMLALLVSFAMTLYYLRSPLRSIGDEYEIATQLGIDKALVEIPFALMFILGFILGLRRLDSWRVRLKWLGAVLLGSVPTGFLLMVADGWVRELVNRGNPFFQPLLGYSLPVLLTYLLTALGVVLWGYKTERVLYQS